MKPKKIIPRIIPKPKIGRDKYLSEIDSLKKIDINNLRKITFYKHPGEKAINVSGDRLNSFSVINNKRYDVIFKNILEKRLSKKRTKDIRQKGSLFYFKLQDSSKNPKFNKGNAIPDLFLFIDGIFKYSKTKHGYEVIAIVNPEKKVLGYTTIKINHVFMKNITQEIQKSISENKSLLETRKKITRFLVHKASTMEGNKKNKKTVFNVLNILKKFGFEVYFTPENGYRLDKNFNFVPEAK